MAKSNRTEETHQRSRLQADSKPQGALRGECPCCFSYYPSLCGNVCRLMLSTEASSAPERNQ